MNALEKSDFPLEQKLSDAIAQIAVAMRAASWNWFGSEGLNPTQGQILSLLQRRSHPLRLSEIADELAVTAATVSDSVNTLVEKKLVAKGKAPDDGRALAIRLTANGKRLINKQDIGVSPVQSAAALLPQSDQVAMYRALLQIIRELQRAGQISVARTCITCRYFRPNIHKSKQRPHHCALVNVSMGDHTLRNDCAEHEAADEQLAAQNWDTFTGTP